MEQERKKQRMNIRVGEKETEIIMEAYMHKGEQDWKSVLRETRERMNGVPMNSRLSEFYLEGEDSRVLRRMKRIVREELKKQAFLYQESQESERQEKQQVENTKHTNLTDSEEDSEEDSDHDEIRQQGTSGKPDKERGIIERQMTYAAKKAPTERIKTKFSAFVEFDENEDDATPQPAKKKTLREVSYDAQTCHKAMCEKASMSLDLMNNVLKKLENKLDEF